MPYNPYEEAGDAVTQAAETAQPEEGAPPEEDSPPEEQPPQEPERLRPEPRQVAPRQAGRPKFYNELGDEIPEGSAYANTSPALSAYRTQQAQFWAALPAGMKQEVMLNQIKLSQKEQIEMQRMQNAMAVIKADPNLSDDDKAAALMQVQTKINPWTMRAAKAKALQTEMENQRVKQNAQQVSELNNLLAEGKFADWEKKTGVHVDPTTGKGSYHFGIDQHGNKVSEPWQKHQDEMEKLKVQETTKLATHMAELKEKQAQRAETAEGTAVEEDKKTWDEFYHKTHQLVKGDHDVFGSIASHQKNQFGTDDRETYLAAQAKKRGKAPAKADKEEGREEPMPAQGAPASVHALKLSRAASKAGEAFDWDARESLWDMRNAMDKHGSVAGMPKDVFAKFVKDHETAKKYLVEK